MARLTPFLALSIFALPALFFAGCTTSQNEVAVVSSTAVPSTPAPAKPVVLSDKERIAKFCRVCDIEHGKHGEEFLPTRLDKVVNGQKYRFCADICREKFDKSPAKYLAKPKT